MAPNRVTHVSPTPSPIEAQPGLWLSQRGNLTPVHLGGSCSALGRSPADRPLPPPVRLVTAATNTLV